MSPDAHAQSEKIDHNQVPVPTVSSVGQRSGVTAGVVNQLNQIMPTLVRGPQLEKLKAIFTDGAKTKREFVAVTSDPDIDKVCTKSQNWINSTFHWLHSNVSEYAAERFAFMPIEFSISYHVPWNSAEGYADKWGNCRRELTDFLINLDQLMRDPSIYPTDN